VEYDELLLFVTPVGKSFLAEAVMDLGKDGGIDTEVDSSAVVPVSLASRVFPNPGKSCSEKM